MDKIRGLWQRYDEASNRATDCLIDSIEARKIGKTALSNYLETKMYKRLKKQSYHMFIRFSDAVETL